jgi:hypothetical protein
MSAKTAEAYPRGRPGLSPPQPKMNVPECVL